MKQHIADRILVDFSSIVQQHGYANRQRQIVANLILYLRAEFTEKEPRQEEQILSRLLTLTENQTAKIQELILAVNQNKKRSVRLGFAFGLPALKRRKQMEITLTNEQQIKVHLLPVTEAGKPTKLDGAPVWSVVSGPGKVVAAADGLSADLITDDTDLGDTVFLVDADADLGSGKEDVQDTILMHTAHANAKTLGIFFDKPILKADVPPAPPVAP